MHIFDLKDTNNLKHTLNNIPTSTESILNNNKIPESQFNLSFKKKSHKFTYAHI